MLRRNQIAGRKAVSIALPPQATVRDAFHAIGAACLEQITDNVGALLAGQPEGVHQMRVGARRLRVAIKIFADVLPDRQTARIKAELKWLAGELADARQYDMLMARVVSPATPDGGEGDLDASLRTVVDRRRAARERAQSTIRSRRFRQMIAEVAAWLENGTWTRPRGAAARQALAAPAADFAATTLTRLRKSIRKKGRDLAKMSMEQRHKLRIRGKTLLYAGQFFEAAFPGDRAARRRKPFVSALKKLVDRLGRMNDIAAHEALLSAAGAADPSGTAERPAQPGLAAGVLADREVAQLGRVLKGAIAAHRAFAEAKRFWR